MKRFYAFSAFALCAQLVFGQTNPFSQNKFPVQYPEGQATVATEKSQGGERTTHYLEDFQNGLSNWSPVALEGFVNWTSTITGPSNPNFFSPLQSTTPSNRWAMLDSDGNGTTGFEEHSELRMNASIDLTGATNTQLSFKQMHRAFNNDTTSVAVSGDGGSTWTTFVINELLPPNQSTANPETITFDISSIADNSPNVRLRFIWKGEYDYGWQIDDIEISSATSGGGTNDLVMNDNGFNSGVEYTRIPVDHVDSYLPYANVQNAGSNNQSNVQLATNISRNGSTVYNGTSNSASLMLANTSGFFSPTNTYSPTQLGTYTYTNTISQTETDATPANNSSSSTFEVTPGEYALDNNMPDGNYQGSGVGYSVGNGYEMFSTSNVRSVSAYIDGQTTIGTEVKAELFTMNIQGNFISVAESNPYLVTSDDLNSWVTLSINGGYTTSSGQILFAFFSQDFGTPGNMVISSAQQNFANTSFSLDGSTTFQLFFVPMVRLQLGNQIIVNSQNQTDPTCEGACDGSLSVSASGGTGSLSYLWQENGNTVGTTQTVTNLCAGTYTLSITDNNGTVPIQTFVLSAPNSISISALSNDPTCDGVCDGSISINGNGGAGSLTYSIDNGATFSASGSFSNLCAGTYQVLARDGNGCTSTASNVTLTAPPVPQITATVTATSSCGACDGAISVTALGGNATYVWTDLNGAVVGNTNSIANLCDGTYSLSINDGTCTFTSNHIVTGPPIAAQGELCRASVSTDNQSIVLNWPEHSANEVTSFNVYREDNGTFELIGTAANSPTPTFTDVNVAPAFESYQYQVIPTDVCGSEGQASSMHQTMFLEGEIQGNDIKLDWTGYTGVAFGNVKVELDFTGSGNFQTIGNLSPGTTTFTDINGAQLSLAFYRISVTPTNCGSEPIYSNTISSAQIGIGEARPSFDFTVFPNPTSNTINVDIPARFNTVEVAIFNTIGQQVFSDQTQGGSIYRTDLNDLPAGMYFIRITTEGLTGTQTITLSNK